jgi:ribosomal protein L6P/L9E
LIPSFTGSNPVCPVRLKGKQKKIKERSVHIMAYLQVTENDLEIGDVLSITSDNGKTLKALQMLIGNQTKASMSIDFDNNCLVFKVNDTDMNLPQLQCNLSKSTIKNMICGLKEFYNLLSEEATE